MCLSLFFYGFLDAVIVGSDTAVSKQSRIFFPQADLDNSIIGFTVVNDGITFENSATTGSYNGFFHISGDVAFNQGKFVLNQNIEFKSPLNFGIGYIDAQLFSILFPDNLSVFYLPNTGHSRVFSIADQETIPAAGTVARWSHDGNYIAVATQSAVAGNELTIYLESDGIMTYAAASNAFNDNNVNSIDWHPASYRIAATYAGGLFADKVQTFSFIPQTNSLESLDAVSFIGNGAAVAWHPDGNFLAVAEQNSSTLRVYPIDETGVFGAAITATLSLGATMLRNALVWHPSGNYLAVGCAANALGAELFVYDFDGNSLTAAGSQEIAGTINSLSWKPGTTILSVGHAATGDRLLSYEYDSSGKSFTEKSSMRTGLQEEVLSLRWDSNGECLFAGVAATASNVELQAYVYEPNDERLNLVAGYSLSGAANSVDFHPINNQKVVTADGSAYATVFDFAFPQNSYGFVFEDAKIFFKSDIVFNGPILFKGNCILNGGNNTLDMSSSGSIIVDSQGNLTIEDVAIKNYQGSNIYCTDESCAINFREVELNQSGYAEFPAGQLTVLDRLEIHGREIFSYTSSSPFIIKSNSQLLLDQGSTFSFAPQNLGEHLFVLENKDSEILLNGSSLLFTGTHYNLTKGSLQIFADSQIGLLSDDDLSTVDKGITLGDEQSSLNDLKITIHPGALLACTEGVINHKNLLSTSINLVNSQSVFRMGTGSTLRIFTDLDLQDGRAVWEPGSSLQRVVGKTIHGSMQMLGSINKTIIMQ